MRTAAAATVMTACLALLAGCGGSGASAQMTRYVAAASAICTREAVGLTETPRPTTPAQAIAYLPHDVAIVDREVGRLASVAVPAAKRASFDGALTSARQLAALLTTFLRRLQAGTLELATFAQVQSQANTLRDQINAGFRQTGLPRCVHNP